MNKEEKSMRPVISIIVPIYNVEHYLRECLESILNQTFKQFELILVNDGSSDKSGKICAEYAKLDNRVILINKNYGGVSSARNTGLAIAKGEYIGFVDSDDYIHKDMYKDLYELCNKTNSDISISKLGREVNGEVINKEKEFFIKEMDNSEAMKELFKGILYRFSLCNKLFKKKCFNGIQFPEGRIHEDLSTTYRLFANSNKATYINKIGYIYVKRENSILTTRFSEKRMDAFIGWEEIIRFMNSNYTNLEEEYMSCFAFAVTDYIYYALNQAQDKVQLNHYLRLIQSYGRKHYGKIVKNKRVSIKSKYSIFFLLINIKLFKTLLIFRK